MSKLVRCTVCVWRGTDEDARLARPVERPSIIPRAMEEHQNAYEEVRQAHSLPGCPSCGHHLTPVVKHHRRGSIHP
jgi:hypothetical protein